MEAKAPRLNLSTPKSRNRKRDNAHLTFWATRTGQVLLLVLVVGLIVVAAAVEKSF